MTDDLKTAAARALACLDLTNLNDDCTEDDVRRLCAAGDCPEGAVAAVCVWPRFVPVARESLLGLGIRVATVVAFPSGTDATADVLDMTEAAVRDGADEIDMVIPYAALLEGRSEVVPSRVARVKAAAGGATVKAILETGVLGAADTIRHAAELAIEGGADFLKTSTGKVPINATPEAARVLLETIREADRPVGLKTAGGVRTVQDAAGYLDLCDEIMGEGWAEPATFRIGASSLLSDLLATLRDETGAPAGDAY